MGIFISQFSRQAHCTEIDRASASRGAIAGTHADDVEMVLAINELGSCLFCLAEFGQVDIDEGDVIVGS